MTVTITTAKPAASTTANTEEPRKSLIGWICSVAGMYCESGINLWEFLYCLYVKLWTQALAERNGLRILDVQREMCSDVQQIIQEDLTEHHRDIYTVTLIKIEEDSRRLIEKSEKTYQNWQTCAQWHSTGHPAELARTDTDFEWEHTRRLRKRQGCIAVQKKLWKWNRSSIKNREWVIACECVCWKLWRANTCKSLNINGTYFCTDWYPRQFSAKNDKESFETLWWSLDF